MKILPRNIFKFKFRGFAPILNVYWMNLFNRKYLFCTNCSFMRQNDYNDYVYIKRVKRKKIVETEKYKIIFYEQLEKEKYISMSMLIFSKDYVSTFHQNICQFVSIICYHLLESNNNIFVLLFFKAKLVFIYIYQL